MNRTDRMYALVEALRSAGPRGRSSTWLAERFSISARTVKRDIAALQAAGTPVVGQDGRGGGYQLARHAAVAARAFTAGEAAAVAIAIAAAPGLPFSSDAHAALEKILAAMTRAQQDDVAALAARVWMRDRSAPSSKNAVHLLDEALRQNRVARIDYTDAAGNVTNRHVEPMVFARTGGRWYLLAWCRKRRAGRWFDLSRVRRVRLTKERCGPRSIVDVFGDPPDDAHPVDIRSARLHRRRSSAT